MNRPLTVSGIVVKGDQSMLWDWVDDRALDMPAMVRNEVGTFFEEASRLLFQADRHQIDGRADVCPDLSVGRNRFIEIKSIGQSRQGLIYKHRLERDRMLVKNTGGSLTYVFWIHNVPATEYRSRHELRAALARGVDRVLVVPFERISAACRRLTALPCNYRTSNRNGKEEREPTFAYRLPFRLLQHLARGRCQWQPDPFLVSRCAVSDITVSGPALERVLRPLDGLQRQTAAWMREELLHTHLDVVLAPAPHPKHPSHRIRIVQSRNPEWYRDLCSRRTSPRKRSRSGRHHDTDIRRRFVLGSLARLSAGRITTNYDLLVLPYVRHLASA